MLCQECFLKSLPEEEKDENELVVEAMEGVVVKEEKVPSEMCGLKLRNLPPRLTGRLL